ncbi:helix-turn-helix domain-containing protein [Streptomyces sp. NPDC005525]|uniref:helix-turn-helix domain-containing protein n=1 Tax=Streptomyces sp. NPDC005525 TaxID=3364720 RepID=UPI0036B5A177
MSDRQCLHNNEVDAWTGTRPRTGAGAKSPWRLPAPAAEAFASGRAISQDAIANRAGVGNAILYRPFPTREDLLEEVLPGPDPPLARRCAHLAGYRVARVGPPRVDAPIRRLGRRTTRHPRGPGVLPSPLKSLAVLLGGAKRPAASRGNHGSGPPQQIRCLLRHRPGGPSGRQESERRPPSGTGADLTGELLGQPLVSEVDLDSLAGVPAELLGDALTADGAAV